MAEYRARMIDSTTGGEGRYDFEADDDLFRHTPVRIIRKFMEHVEKNVIPENFQDYELNAAFKNDKVPVVTGLGSLALSHDPALPFAVMITPKAVKSD